MRIVLCGSTRFVDEGLWDLWNKALTLKGHRVTTISFVMSHADQEIYPEKKIHLDLVHLAKIMDADAIVVLNKGDYIGDSTKREVAWARMIGRLVYWLEYMGSEHARSGESSIARLMEHNA